MEDDVDPDQLELHVHAGQQEDDDEERDRQVDDRRAAQELEPARLGHDRRVATSQPNAATPIRLLRIVKNAKKRVGSNAPGIRQRRSACDHDRRDARG